MLGSSHLMQQGRSLPKALQRLSGSEGDEQGQGGREGAPNLALVEILLDDHVEEVTGLLKHGVGLDWPKRLEAR